MGIERFFSSINKEFDIIINTSYPYQKIECEYLMIDFNSIVHIISQNMINTIHQNKNIKNNTAKQKDNFNKELINNVKIYIYDLLKNNIYSDKLQYLYIAIDGVPTMAKMYEQKKRRFMSVILSNLYEDEKDKFTWSKNNISPGNNFMNELQKELNNDDFKNNIKKICPNLINYILSDTTEPDEGEMKIINYIKKNNIPNEKKIVVYSPDSDMIILLLLLNQNLTILRYDQQTSKIDNIIFNIISVNKFKDILYKYISSRVDNYTFNNRRVYDDIVFIMTVFGDDFLPKLESLRVNLDIYLLLDYYVINYIYSGYLIEYNNIYRLRTQSFLNLLKLINNNELLFLKRNAKHHIYNNYSKIEKDILSSKLYLFRDLSFEYIWKFIYLNRNIKKPNKTINNINISKHININIFLKFLSDNEPIIENKEIQTYANREFKYMNTIIIKELKKIFMENYLEIIRVIDIEKLYNNVIENKLYFNRKHLLKNFNKLYYLVDDKENIFIDFLIYIYNYNSLPVNIELYNIQTIELKKISFSSNEYPHNKKIKYMDSYNKELYKIEYKLDKYEKILNPKDEFYYKYFESGFPKREEIDNYYKIHFKNVNKKDIINSYLEGLNWVLNYYFNFIVNKTWYYKYSKSPLIYDIIDNYNYKILQQVKIDKYKLNFFTPLEQLIFISPIDLNKDIYLQLSIDDKYINNIVKFINENPEYFFNLTEIINNIINNKDKNIDCSNSIFLNKCHLIFLEKDINIDKYLETIRKYIII
jgi:5'-3' exoribonuclease 2